MWASFMLIRDSRSILRRLAVPTLGKPSRDRLEIPATD